MPNYGQITTDDGGAGSRARSDLAYEVGGHAQGERVAVFKIAPLSHPATPRSIAGQHVSKKPGWTEDAPVDARGARTLQEQIAEVRAEAQAQLDLREAASREQQAIAVAALRAEVQTEVEKCIAREAAIKEGARVALEEERARLYNSLQTEQKSFEERCVREEREAVGRAQHELAQAQSTFDGDLIVLRSQVEALHKVLHTAPLSHG
ncbi:hypothetical protein CYMTET_50457 [Cymbomonas tetramitiformis]|uniref:Uncharacterized protein n=1 Tax=Cymbomonas tetramitiformis TaxID=36881 RepID=A0AAE0BN64_9CHLO|nr:hypothetical protein CYMTET_50457 [Cymbomonas tetramitiformis]